MRAVLCTQAAAATICFLAVLAVSQLQLVDCKSSSGSSGGKSSGGSSSGGSKSSTGSSSSKSSSMSSSAKASAAAAAGGTSKTSWGGGKSGGKWTFGGSTTMGGSTLYKGSGGKVYSSRPQYYGSGAHTSSVWIKRPIVWGAVAGVTVFAFYGHSYARLPTCGSYFYAYGSGCRSCSNWECPIGQYRVPCTAWTDSYCTRCTNAPSDAEYTSPGNWGEDGGGCQYSEEPPFPVPTEIAPTEPASLQIIFEIPTPSLSFNDNTASFIAAVAAVAGVPIGDVRIEGIEERPVSSISSCPDAQCPLYQSAIGELTSASFQKSGRRNAGAPDGCSTTPDGSEKVSLVSMAVDTVVDKVDQTWNNLNEYDVNKAMARACLWPAVMTYDQLDPGASSSANTIQRGWVYSATALSLVLLLVNF